MLDILTSNYWLVYGLFEPYGNKQVLTRVSHGPLKLAGRHLMVPSLSLSKTGQLSIGAGRQKQQQCYKSGKHAASMHSRRTRQLQH